MQWAWAKQHKEWQWASEHVLAQAGQPPAQPQLLHIGTAPVQLKPWHRLTAHIGGKRTESLRWHL